MTRLSLSDVGCSIARATDLLSDAWTALIMRDVLVGITRFDDLVEDLGISRKVLSARLHRLIDEGVLVRERYQDNPPRDQYRPTAKGEELYQVLLALMAWGDRWYGEPAGPPVLIRHHDCGHETHPTVCCDQCGGPITLRNSTQLPGPGGRPGPGTRLIGPLLATRTLPPDQLPD